MKINDLIQALAEQGIATTEAEIKAQLGDISKLDPSDIPTIAELWKSDDTSGQMAKSMGGKLSIGSNSSIQANRLPDPAGLSYQESAEWIQRIEALPSRRKAGQKISSFLAALYNKISETNAETDLIISAFNAQTEESAQTLARLNGVLQTVADNALAYNKLANQIESVVGHYCPEGEPKSPSFGELIRG